jgi:CheY-like chemotaxis protein
MQEGPADPRRVLVIDDYPDTAETLATLLHMWGFEARIAHDGPTGLAVADSYRPQVVLLDIGMPRMTGFDVARTLRQRSAFSDTFIVSLSGHCQESDYRLAQEAGCDLHLAKPVEPEILRRLLDTPLPQRHLQGAHSGR